jgi:hypothetical protein
MHRRCPRERASRKPAPCERLARTEERLAGLERVREALTWQIAEETVGLRGSKNGIGQRTVQL